jgi:uncharacterized protein YecE (DUF72 family)
MEIGWWSQNITHLTALDVSEEDVEKFLAVIDHAENKKGCLLFQFPPGLHASAQRQLFRLLEIVSNNANSPGWKIALEFRHPSWYEQLDNKELQSYNATIVTHDMPNSATLLAEIDTDFLYLRFHGPGGKYRGSYDDPFLEQQAELVTKNLSKGKDVYAYFNNTMGNALGNVNTLKQLIQK